MAEPKTKQAAIETLEAMRQEVVHKLDDKEIADILSEDLLMAVFNEAWRLQLEDDATAFMRAARDIVVEAANQATSGDTQ